MTGKIPLKGLQCLFILLFSVRLAFGADIKISSIVNPTQLSINNRLTITVTVSGADAHKAKNPVFKQMPDFTIVNQPSTSTHVSIVNGVISRSKTYTYHAIPNKIGTFVVGGAGVSDGKDFYSAPGMKVTVTGKKSAQTITIPQNANPNIFIRTLIDRKEPYVGEQITLSFELFNRLTIWGDTEYTPPSTTGFWTMALPKIPNETRVLDSRIFQYSAIKTALFPTTSGKLTIGAASINYTTGGFFSSQRTRTLQSQPIAVKVKPLPEKGKPADFNGAVGDYGITAAADKTNLKVGDVVTIEVTVSGTGNLNLVSSLNTPDFSAFKTYDPKVSDMISNSGFVVGGGKTWEFILMPKFQGNITVGPISLSFFNPGDKSYHTVSTREIKLIVAPGEVVSSVRETGSDNRDSIRKIANDINYIKPDKRILKNSDRQLYSNKLFYLFYILPITIFSASFVLKRRHDTIERNTGLKRRLNAWKKVQKSLSDAETLKTGGEKEAFYGKLSESITEFIGDLLNIDTGGMTNEEFNEAFKENGVDTEVAELTVKTLELCDFFRFSSSGSGQDMQEKLFRDTSDILDRLRELL